MAITPTIAGLAEQIAELKGKVERLYRPTPPPIRFAAYQTKQQNIAASTNVPIVLDHAIKDTAGGSSLPGSRYYCQKAGTYWLSGFVGFASGATSERSGKFQVNGIDVPGSAPNLPHSAGVTNFALPGVMVDLASGDYVELVAYSPEATTTGVSFAGYSSRLDLFRMG